MFRSANNYVPVRSFDKWVIREFKLGSSPCYYSASPPLSFFTPLRIPPFIQSSAAIHKAVFLQHDVRPFVQPITERDLVSQGVAFQYDRPNLVYDGPFPVH